MTKNEKKKRDRRIIVTVVAVVVIVRLRKDVKHLKRDVDVLRKSTGEIINYLHANHGTMTHAAGMAKTK